MNACPVGVCGALCEAGWARVWVGVAYAGYINFEPLMGCAYMLLAGPLKLLCSEN